MVTNEKKLFDIAELFNDDQSLVATAIKCCGASEKQHIILNRIQSFNTDKISSQIDILYKLTRDHFNIDGIVSLVEQVHLNTVHEVDHTFDEEKQQFGLLYFEEN